jgi:hypothetical protein
MTQTLEPNLTDFPLDFYVEYDIERGCRGDRETPPTDDYIYVNAVYLHSVLVDSVAIKTAISVYVNEHPEALGLECIDGRIYS